MSNENLSAQDTTKAEQSSSLLTAEPQAATDGAQGAAQATPQAATTKTTSSEGEAKAEELKLALSENSILDQEHLSEVSQFAKEKGLSQEVAQEILKRDEGLISDFVKAIKDDEAQMKASWKDASVSDKEFGGDKLKENVENAHRALKQFASQELFSFLNQTGLGDHPELIRVFARIGKVMANDKLIQPNSQPEMKKSAAENFFPNMNP